MIHTREVFDRLAPFALGLPGADEDGSLATHIEECDECAAETYELREAATLLALGTDTPSSHANLRGRILERIGRGRFVFALSSEGGWLQQAGGVQTKQLYASVELGCTSLIALPASRRIPKAPPPHTGDLGYVVIRGELENDGVRLDAGKFLREPTGKWSGGARAITDAVLLAVSRPPVGGKDRAPLTVRESAREWSLLAPGTLALSLAGSAAEGLEISLVRMERETAVPGHRHEGLEELCLISGDCRCQGVELGPEDYHRAGSGTNHDVTTTVGGCTMVYILRGSGAAGQRGSES